MWKALESHITCLGLAYFRLCETVALDIFFFFSLNVCKFGDADSSLPRMNENAQNLRWDVNSWQRYGEAQLGNFCGLCATVTSSLQRKAALPRIPLAEPTSHAVFLDGVSAVLQSV